MSTPTVTLTSNTNGINVSGIQSGTISSNGFNNPLNKVGRCKVYIVDEDDFDRERVLSFEVDGVHIKTEVDTAAVYVGSLLDSPKIFKNNQRVVVEQMTMVPRSDGTLYSIENFQEQFDEEEDDE